MTRALAALAPVLLACSAPAGAGSVAFGEASPVSPHPPASAATASASSSTPPVAAPAPVAASPLAVRVAWDRGELTLLPVEGALLVGYDMPDPADPTAFFKIGSQLGLVEGERVTLPRQLELTYPEDMMTASFGITGVSGRYPDALLLHSTELVTRTGMGVTYRHEAGRFVRTKLDGYRAAGTLLGADGSVAILRRTGPYSGAGFAAVVGKAPALALTSTGECTELDGRPGPDLVEPLAVARAHDGEVLAVGNDCRLRPVMERWRAGSSRSELVPLAGLASASSPGLEAPVALLADADATFLVARGLYRVEGGALLPVAPPVSGGACVSATRLAGKLWAVCAPADEPEHHLFRETASSWERVPLPAGHTLWASSRVARAPDARLWVTARAGEDGGALLTLGAPTSAPQRLELPAAPRGPRRPTPMADFEHCPFSHVVVLFTFAKTTPDDYDFPLTRDAMKGARGFEKVRFEVATEAGRRFLVAVSPDLATSKRLAAHIEKRVRGAKPQLVCGYPTHVRDVSFD